MSDKHGVDPVKQQELLDRYRRELDDYDHLHNVRKATQAQNVKVSSKYDWCCSNVKKVLRTTLKM